MQIEVLGPSGLEAQWTYPSSLLVDDFLLLDTGGLTHRHLHQRHHPVEYVLITHAHFDHILGLPFLVEARICSQCAHPVTVLSSMRVIADLRTHIFNGAIWPDFEKVPDPSHPLLIYREIEPERAHSLKGYTIEAVEVSHSVPTLGYILTSTQGHSLLYAGDTGPTQRIWDYLGDRHVDVLIIEVSFPNHEEHLARITGHLTPWLLERELKKLQRAPRRILINHLKPCFRSAILRELQAVEGLCLEVLETGRTYEI